MRNLSSTQSTQPTIGAPSATTPVPRTWTSGLIGTAVGVALGALLGLAIATTAMPAPTEGLLSASAGSATDAFRAHLLRENGER